MRKNQQCDFRSAVTRTERKPHHSLCLGKSWSARVLWENRYLVFVNSHRSLKLKFSSTSRSVLWPMKCTSPSSGALVPTETRQGFLVVFFFFFFFFLLYWVSISCMAISLFETSGGYSLLAGCMASRCGGFFCCGAPALGTRASLVLLHRLSICPSA